MAPPKDPPASSGKAGGSKIPEPLQREIGPFPLWGWLAILGSGVALGLGLRAWRSRRSSATSTSSGDPEPTPPSIVPTVVRGPGTVGLPVGTAPTTPTKPTSNLEWSIAAIQYLISTGKAATVVQPGIAKFLKGDPITSQQATYVDEAVKALGPPPEGAPAVTILDTPTTPTPVQPTGPAAGPPDLTSWSNPRLIDHANWAITPPMVGTPIGNQEVRRADIEVLRRAREHSISVNEPAQLWKDAAGNLRPYTSHVFPKLLKQADLINKGVNPEQAGTIALG